jgi:tRNA-binding protein
MQIAEMEHASMEDFERLDIRVGTIVRAEPFPEARKPAYKLWVDLGGGDVRRSSAQITDLYTPESLVGRQVVCVCGFPAKQIGPWMSEVLVTGFHHKDGSVILCVPDAPMQNGTQLR